jgi:hypothetical protein
MVLQLEARFWQSQSDQAPSLLSDCQCKDVLTVLPFPSPSQAFCPRSVRTLLGAAAHASEQRKCSGGKDILAQINADDTSPCPA